ncbi:MFS transporter [Candidatus Dojkabacteria bacterium]|nr:MFS transporter [Candidatus Dojkabacteria bacterium]
MNSKFLAKIYAYALLYDLTFAYAVYNLLFSNNGLNNVEISILLGWWAFVAVVFEIPSGVLADKVNRKWLIVAAPVLKAIAFLLWGALTGSFLLYALGFLIWGLASTLLTGTYQAYIYDVLARDKMQDAYEKVISGVNFSKKFGVSLGLIFGGLIASISIELVMIASIFPLIFGTLIALSFVEVRAKKQSEEIKYLEYIKDAINFIRSSKIIRFLFFSLVVLSIYGNIEEYDQLYFKLVDLPVAFFGVIAFIPFMGAAIVEGLSYKLKGNRLVFVLLPLISAALLLISGLLPSIPTLITLIFSYIVIAPLSVLIDGRIQHEIVGQSRATVISFSNFLKHIFGIGYFLIFGLIIQISTFEGIYIFSAVVLLLFSGLALFRHNE